MVCARIREGSFGGPGPISDALPRRLAGSVLGRLPGIGGGPDVFVEARIVGLRTGSIGREIGSLADSV